MNKPRYIVGLDLGQAQDFTALAVLQSTSAGVDAQRRTVRLYAVRYLQRLPLGTPYTDVCQQLVERFAGPPLQYMPLVVDHTGVGLPVIDLLQYSGIQASLRPVTITAGNNAHCDESGHWLVPKKDLVGTLQILLQSRRLRLASRLPEAKLLVDELNNFRVRITVAANETFGVWREGQHDDLVLAVAMACWWGERGYDEAIEVTADPRARSLLADVPTGDFLTDGWP